MPRLYTIKAVFKEAMKTGLRLQTINAMIKDNYTHIWDCCCDHGLLGMTILKRQLADTVHFVDIVDTITAQVDCHLCKHFSDQAFANKWQVHCTDVAKLPLARFTTDNQKHSHLIIIAGVGGDLLIDFVQQIVTANPTLKLEFILCPVHHNYKVRQALIELNFNLIDEVITCENKRFYEVIHVIRNSTSNEPIANVGSKMWDLSDPLHQKYLTIRLNHYQRIQNNPNKNVSEIIQAYQALKA